MTRVRPLNLGLCFFLQTLRHLGRGRVSTDLAEIKYTFDLILDQKSTKMFAKSVHRQPRKGVSDETFEGKKHQPKFKGQTLLL